MLPLDAHSWANLADAYGNAGEVPSLLLALARRADVWSELYASLCPQGAPYEAAFAAVPHVVSIASLRAADERVEHLTFVGMVAAGDVEVPSKLAEAYVRARTNALELVVEALRADVTDDEAAALVWTALALRGIHRAAQALMTFVDGTTIQTRCPGDSCGVELYLDHRGDGWTPLFLPGDEFGPSSPVEPPDHPEADTEWTDRTAPAQMAAIAEHHGYPTLATKLRSLMGTVQCPKCGQAFVLWDEILEPSEL